MKKIKYVMLDSCLPVIFGDYWNHSEVAQKLKDLGEVTSAGFLSIGNDEVTTYGDSISLNMKPDQSDSAILTILIKDV